jgi:hypothetical protein
MPHASRSALVGTSFAVLAEQPPVGVEVQDRVVDRSAMLLTLVDPYHQVHAGVAGGGTEALGRRPGHHHRLLQQPHVPGLVLARQDLVDPGRPGGQEGFGEDQQAGPVRRRLLDQRHRLLEAGLQVQEHRGGLGRGHLDLRLRHGSSPEEASTAIHRRYGVVGLWMTACR